MTNSLGSGSHIMSLAHMLCAAEIHISAADFSILNIAAAAPMTHKKLRSGSSLTPQWRRCGFCAAFFQTYNAKVFKVNLKKSIVELSF